MKTLTLCLSVILGSLCPVSAQTPLPQVKLLAKHDSLGIRVMKLLYPRHTDYYLVSGEKDSVLFHSLAYRFDTDPLIYEGMYIQALPQHHAAGKREIQLLHVVNNNKIAEDTKTMYIINTATKQTAFEGRYYYRVKDGAAFSYQVTFDREGNLIVDYTGLPFGAEPDRKEGIYSLTDGKYTWIKSKYLYSRRVIASSDSLDFKIVQISRCEKPLSEYFAVFNKGADSVAFEYDYSCASRSPEKRCTISARQLDQQGRDEVILEYSTGDADRNSTSLMIFNPDTRKMIFRGSKQFFAMYQGEQIATCTGYSCNIDIKDSGALIVSYPAGGCMPPPLKAGVYGIRDGLYIWTGQE